MKKPVNVVFMGTPDFAVPALYTLLKSGFKVSLVVTQPDKPKGRGRALTPPPVKTAAEKRGIPVIQPDSVKTSGFFDQIQAAAPDLLVVVAFGHVLPKKILEIAPMGAINVHASLLPKYRGPAPIQWAIINGETETGVTTMLMDEGLDTGDILLSMKTPVYPGDTSATLHDRLAVLGAEALGKTVEGLSSRTIRPLPQNHDLATYAPILTKAHGRIDWSLSAARIERFVRGMTPWPGAYTFWGEMRLKILKASVLSGSGGPFPGRIMEGMSNELWVATGDGMLSILEIQGSSGKRLPIADFLRGCPIPAGAALE